MERKYKIRRAERPEDADKLKTHFNVVFQEEEVGELAYTFFHHLPGLERRHWFIAQDRGSGEAAAAFVLIPWEWEFEGIHLSVAEMGIVGTGEKHRGQGLIRKLYKEFEAVLEEEGFDLSVIQGIPGFYHKFGYYYALSLENHIELPLHAVPEGGQKGFEFRRAKEVDIPFLMLQDEVYRKDRTISVKRDRATWEYLLTYSQETDCGSEYWIFNRGDGERYYSRIPYKGFGEGLIVSEVSENISFEGSIGLFSFCKGLAREREKPFIRLNLPSNSVPALSALHLGANQGPCYAWQVKVPSVLHFLSKISSLFEKRIAKSPFSRFTGTLHLNFYREAIDFQFEKGLLTLLPAEKETSSESFTFCIPEDLFPPLVLGHRTWRELRCTRPDIFPMGSYSAPSSNTRQTGLMMDYLFPPLNGWIHERY